MPEYEGFVASLRDDGKAEVLIQPERAEIVGAPEASTKVCQCASGRSEVTLEALNPVEAGVGDRVSVKLETAALIKNAGTLIGIPILALILGWASSLMVPDRGLPGVPLKLLLVFLSLPLGIAVGFAFYRRFSRRNNPVITRVIEKRADRVSRFEELQ